jgi:hypothetical protein
VKKIFKIILLFVSIFETKTFAQQPANPPFSDIYRRPIVSPYMALGGLQDPMSPPIYHNQVLPLKQQQKQIKEILNQKQALKSFSKEPQTKNFNIIGEKQKGIRPTGHNTGLYDSNEGIRPTGHVTNFMNLSHYY